MKAITTISIFLFLSITYSVSGHVSRKKESVTILTSAICGQCKDRIENGLIYEKGIKDVKLDLKTKKVEVEFNPDKTTIEQIRKVISRLGYDADSIAADPVTYQKLPSCCKKDAQPH